MALPVLRRHHPVEQKDHSARESSPPAGRWSPWAEFTEFHNRMGRLLAETLGEQLSRPVDEDL